MRKSQQRNVSVSDVRSGDMNERYNFHLKRKQYILNGNYHYLDDLFDEFKQVEESRDFWKEKYKEIEFRIRGLEK